MSRKQYEAWKARISYFKKDFPFAEKGKIHQLRNELGNLHSDSEPAYRSSTRIIWYKDGKKHGIDADVYGNISYFYENIEIPPNFHAAISKPELLTVEEVLRHPNAECRFVGVKIIGHEKVKESAYCKNIHACKKTGMELFQISGIFEEPVNYLKVINSTQEPDGTFKVYYLCVPPKMKTCKQAVAWTFSLKASEYKPKQET